MRTHGVEHIVDAKAYAARLHHQLFHFLLEQPPAVARARLRQFRDHGANPGARLEVTFLNQMLDDFVGGVGVNLQIRGQRTHRWKCLPRAELARDKRTNRRVYDLIENRLPGLESEAKECHSSSVTLVTPPVKSFFANDAMIAAMEPRVRLRAPRLDDAPFLANLMTPEISQWLAIWPARPSAAEVASLLEATIAAIDNNLALAFVIETAGDGEIIGWTKVARCTGEGASRRGELGYWLGEAHQGKGYGFEAASAAVAIAFHDLDLDVIEAGAQPENPGSLRVIRKLGMQPIGERMIWTPVRQIYELCWYFEVPRPS